MLELQRLRSEHAQSVLEFELANRAYFSSFISDRGDDFFEHFNDEFAQWLEDQDTGTCAYYALVDEAGGVLGRFNLYNLHDARGELGYRVAEHVAGRGVATASVLELCHIAATVHGLTKLRAAVSLENTASRRVLAKAGFVETGLAQPGGRAGNWFERTVN